jgi:hypothetical protein
MGKIEVKENTLRGFSFCLVQIIMLYCTNSIVDSFCFIIVSSINVEFVTLLWDLGSPCCVNLGLTFGVLRFCLQSESRLTFRVLRFCLQSESRFDLQSSQVLFAKLHFRTGNSECHVRVRVQDRGFGRHISVLVCYIPAKYQS